jgi:hypothetical protein
MVYANESCLRLAKIGALTSVIQSFMVDVMVFKIAFSTLQMSVGCAVIVFTAVTRYLQEMPKLEPEK